MKRKQFFANNLMAFRRGGVIAVERSETSTLGVPRPPFIDGNAVY